MKYYLFTFLLFVNLVLFAQGQEYPLAVKKLLKAYPVTIKGYDGESIILQDGTKIKYREASNKLHSDLMNSDNIGDIFTYPYIKGELKDIRKNYDPGRIRSELLLKGMYGSTSVEVGKNLVTIIWCPRLVNQKIRVTSINGVDKQLQKVSDELDQYPAFKDYLKSTGGFYWRKIRGTGRLSTHSFGIAIDLNVKYSNYWQWDCRCTNEDANLRYRNQIPQIIVDIFEKYGFIWGGKWYHYDTMHFEYRPELLVD